MCVFSSQAKDYQKSISYGEKLLQENFELSTAEEQVLFWYAFSLFKTNQNEKAIQIVNKISEYAFQYCYDLNSVEIPSTIDSIGEKAFANCFGLKSIVIPNGVKNIGTAAFYYCENLESITIPESVNTIEKSAFSSCKNVKSITWRRYNKRILSIL